MTYETHHHCQCDFCDGVDCGQDDPEKYAAEQKAQQEEHDAEIRKDERERILDLVDDAISEKSREIDTHSDDGFRRIVYCSEVDKIIGSFRGAP